MYINTALTKEICTEYTVYNSPIIQEIQPCTSPCGRGPRQLSGPSLPILSTVSFSTNLTGRKFVIIDWFINFSRILVCFIHVAWRRMKTRAIDLSDDFFLSLRRVLNSRRNLFAEGRPDCKHFSAYGAHFFWRPFLQEICLDFHRNHYVRKFYKSSSKFNE